MRTCELCMDDHLNMKFVGLWKISEGPTYSLWLQNRDTYSDEYSDTCSSHTHTPGGWVPLIIKEYLTQCNADTQWCRTGIYQAAVAHTELVSTVRCWFCLPLGFVNSERNTEYHHACALKRSLLIWKVRHQSCCCDSAAAEYLRPFSLWVQLEVSVWNETVLLSAMK